MKTLVAGLLALVPLAQAFPQEDCFWGWYDQVTDDWYFLASSAQGAVGDVVAIDVSLVAGNPRKDLTGYAVTCCYDGSALEYLGDPEYTPLHEELVLFPWEGELLEGPPPQKGLALGGSFSDPVAEKYFPNEEPAHLLTLYFRVLGSPGTVTAIRFCEGRFDPKNACRGNRLRYIPRRTDPEQLPFLDARSTRHVPGEVRVLAGEPTQPDRPASPPLAKVYPEPPTPETARIHFEMTGAAARPGSLAVPVDVYVTSNYEFSGVALSITFPRRYLGFAGVKEHIRPAGVAVDDENGHVALAMLNARHRMGMEGEKVKLVTLYFNVEPEALEVQEVSPRFETVNKPGGAQYINFLVIHHASGVAGELPTTSEVAPISTAAGLLMIQREPTYLGDANFDYQVDLSDAVSVLNYLFLEGERLLCPPAADFTREGQLNITDPIALLMHLFQGGPPATLPKDVFCDA
ncbi:MAG: hypothetical protein HY721_35600 [Planctomycetes bacterium]|nr:hypothetical protein [Planctomycetota bacterium]